MIFFASKEKTEDLLYQAMSFMEKKQPKNAIPFFKKVTKQEPKMHVSTIAELSLTLIPDRQIAFQMCFFQVLILPLFS